MGKYQLKHCTLFTEPVLRTLALLPGQPGRAEGEALVREFRDQNLRRNYFHDITCIVKVLSSLRRHDLGLWEEKLLKESRAERKCRQEGGRRDA